MKPQVKSEGPTTAKIAFIGEAPGAVEETCGKPFSGKAGRKFNEVLHRARLVRADCYVTNVVKERPPGNDIGHFIKFKRSGVVTTPEYDTYEKELYEELDSISANVLVPMGETALYALTRKRGITKWRGSILPAVCKLLERKTIPTLHPAYADRVYINTHVIALDMVKARKQSDFSAIRLPRREIHIASSVSEFENFADRCKSVDKIGFDIEVINLEMSCFAVALTPEQVMCVPLSVTGGNRFSPDDEVDIIRILADLLEYKYTTKVGQNIIFDASFLLRKYGIVINPIDDTMIAQGILLPDLPKGLDFLTSIYTNEPYYKDEGKKWKTNLGSDDEFWAYNAKDAAVTLEIFPKIMEQLEHADNVSAYRHQLALVHPLMYPMERGVRVDTEGLRLASIAAGKKIKELTDELIVLCGKDINPNSPKQLAEYFYIQKGIKPYTKKGSITTDETALKRLARKGHEEAKVLLKIRHWSTRKSRYFDIVVDNDNRLRCSYNPVGTKTGRLSSSKTIFETGGNMQNIPDSERRYLLADPGYVIYNLDLAQAENRIVAHIAPDHYMIKAFEDGIDIHKQTASLIFRKPIEDISDEDGSSTIGDGMHSERYWGKKANHALNYDMGYKTFALVAEMSEQEAKFIKDRYHTAYSGVRQYHTWVQAELRRDRTLTNLYGRKRIFLDRWGDGLFKDAYAQIPQSTVADKIDRDGLEFMDKFQGIFGHIEFVAQIHDSIAIQMPISVGADYHIKTLIHLRKSLEAPVTFKNRSFQIPVDIGIGLNLGKKSDDNPEGLRKLKELGDIHTRLATLISNGLEVKSGR